MAEADGEMTACRMERPQIPTCMATSGPRTPTDAYVFDTRFDEVIGV